MSTVLSKCVAALVVLCVAVVASGSPLLSLETEADWGLVTPMSPADWTDLQGANPGFDAEYPGTYLQPELLPMDVDPLYVLEDGGLIEGPGLVMAWGSDNEEAGDYSAAWEYVYPEDPNVIGQSISAGLTAPRWTAAGVQMNSIAIGLVDGMNRLRSWTWVCGLAANPAASTIAWNTLYNVSIGPITAAGPDPGNAVDAVVPGAPIPAIYFNTTGFNAANVISILGIENGNLAAPAAMAPLPPGGLTQFAMWNWWQNMTVTPEPTSMALLAIGALALLRRRKR